MFTVSFCDGKDDLFAYFQKDCFSYARKRIV